MPPLPGPVGLGVKYAHSASRCVFCSFGGSQHGKWMQGELERLSLVVLEGQFIDQSVCRSSVPNQIGAPFCVVSWKDNCFRDLMDK